MTIETKYNIGDEVWVKVQGKPTKFKVVGFYKPFAELLYLIENDDTYIALEAKYLFPTKEELLKSL